MGLFGQSTPFDADIEKATSETNTNENWSLILNVCDKVQSQPRNAKECLKVIMKRLGHTDPHVVMQAITLLDACSNNCGKSFHLEIASREFENEFRRLLAKAQPKVSLKMRQVLKNWAENDYKNDPELNLIPSLYAKLRQEGLDFSNLNEKPMKSAAAKVLAAAAAKDPNVVSSQQEEDDIAKAIELSLKESGKGSPKQPSGGNGVSGGVAAGGGASNASAAYPSLYPSFAGSGSMASITSTGGASNNSASSQPEPRKVRALYDFEAVEENELTFFAGEIIHVLEDTDPNWWKGFTQRAEGLFPSNFVTADLSVEPERLDINQQNKSKKSVQFEDDAKELQQKTEAAAAAAANQRIEIDEGKVDRLLHLLHEANPEDPSQDSDEMLRLEQEVHQMGPLIDAELERVDRKHAQLTQLSSDLVDAINLYHSLMRDDRAAMMGGAGAFMAGMPGLGGYQGAPPNPQILYGAAGYPGVGAFPQQQMPQNYGMPSMPFVATTGQLPTTHNSPMPSISAAATTAPGGPYPPHSASNAQLAMGNGTQPQMSIPMQFQNGHVNSPNLNGGINALPQMPSGPVPTPQQQQNYQMLPPQQQQQQPQITTATTASQMPPNGHALMANNQLQQQQSAAPSHQQFTSLPPQQLQQNPQQQPHAPFMQQQQQQHQVSYASIANGPQAYMGVATQQAPGVMMQQPLPPHLHQHQQPQQQLNHNHQNNGDQFSQLQQQMAAMSMGGGGVGGMALGGGIMNQQQNYLVQNETKNNIPIYQQQR